MNADDEWWCSLEGDEIDRNTAGDPPYDVERVATKIVRKIPDRAEQIIDFGAGTGRLTEAVARRLPNSYFLAVEIAPEIRKRLGARCPWVQRSALLPDFASGYADAVYSVTVLQHIDAWRCQRIIDEIADALRPGGVFVFQYDKSGPEHAGPHNYPINDLQAALWCRGSGLEVEIEQDEVYEEWGWATATKP